MNTNQQNEFPELALPLSSGVQTGHFIFVSSQAATKGDGSPLIGDLREEISGAIHAVEDVLQATGASLDDIVKVTAFPLSAASVPLFFEIYAQRSAAAFPARSPEAPGFEHPDVRIEIEEIGYVGS